MISYPFSVAIDQLPVFSYNWSATRFEFEIISVYFFIVSSNIIIGNPIFNHEFTFRLKFHFQSWVYISFDSIPMTHIIGTSISGLSLFTLKRPQFQLVGAPISIMGTDGVCQTYFNGAVPFIFPPAIDPGLRARKMHRMHSPWSISWGGDSLPPGWKFLADLDSHEFLWFLAFKPTSPV